MNLEELTQLAIKAAKAAGDIILEASTKEIPVDHKDGGSTLATQVVTEIDRQCDALIRSFLEPTCKRYDFAMLTEEQVDDKSRLEKPYFWCVDPLDGTLAFIRKEPGYAVSIALVSREGIPIIGVVYNPIADVLVHAIQGKGVFRNEKSWKPSKRNRKKLTYVTEHPLAHHPKSAEIMQLLQQKMKKHRLESYTEVFGGGAVWNAIRVLEEAPALMLKPPKKDKGSGSFWDYAATACIFLELGYQATDYYGEPLALNKRKDTYMNLKGIFYGAFMSS